MNEVKKGAVKRGLITFGLTLLATVIGGIIVDQFVRHRDTKAALASTKEAAQPPRQVVTTTVPVEEPTV